SDFGQRVIIDSTLRSAYVGIWTTSYQVSPEQFVFITLTPGESTTFTRTYSFSTDGSMRQDCTGDHIVNESDLLALSSAWLTEPGTANWNSSCDVSDPPDDRIDNKDLAALGEVWNRDVTSPAPIAYWSLDETVGLVATDGMDSHDGTLVGFTGDDTQWVTGHLGGALEFDGKDDYVEVENYPCVSGKNPRAVLAWIKTQGVSTSSLPVIAWGKDEPGTYWLLEVDEDQRLRLSCGAGFVSANEQQIGDGDWHHIAVMLDPVDPERPLISDVLLYVDGERRTIYKMEEGEIYTGNVENVRIGAMHNPDNNTFSGLIDEVVLFDTVVGQSAVHRSFLQ
ncbi:MAG: LamG domain-containing protein, partial [Sedimentisphaerales bacterium]|nr:LamG domain-containing protein [Sedimentisphaerales bacterium]